MSAERRVDRSETAHRRLQRPIAFLAALWWTLLAGLAAPPALASGYAPSTGITVETTLPVFDRINNQYSVYANLRNDSAAPLTGPTRLVVEQSSLAVQNAQGTTAAGEPWFTVSDSPGFRLAPGARSNRVRIGFALLRTKLTHRFRVETLVPNRPPVANAGPDQTPKVGETITLDGSASHDPDGDEITYLWSIDQAPPGSTARLSNPGAVRPTVQIDKAGRYVFGLIVDDHSAASAPDQCIVDTRNSAPVANAGPDQSAYVDAIVTLDGSASSDIDGNRLSYLWSPAARPTGSGARLSDPTAIKPWFRIDLPGDYRFDLVVNDGQVDSPADQVQISTLNSAPIAHAGPDQTAHVNDRVTLDGSASSDPDHDRLGYLWALTGKPTGSDAVLDDTRRVDPQFTVDLPGTYVGTLIVNDGAQDSAPDSVTVSTINSRPTADAGPDQTVFTGATATLDGSASADPDHDHLSFDWSLLHRPDGSTAALVEPASERPRLTPDRAGDYIAQLIVSDGVLRSEPDSATVTAQTPPPPNQAPTINSQPVTTATVGDLYSYAVAADDPDHDTLTYSLTAGPAAMAIDPGTGLIHWTPAEADAAASPVAVAVQVTDGRGGTASQPFEVTVAPVTTSTQVPALVGQTRAAAMTQIAAARLGLGTFTYRHDAGHPDGQVTAQGLAAGSRVDLGTPVDLTVSLGPDQGLPPNPETVAPLLDPTVTTRFGTATEFLYTGPNAVQTGVAAGTIEERRAAVIRGKVFDRAVNPLPGVAIRVLDHPELGQTLSRADGAFDLVVNGGGVLTLVYEKSGYLTAQRQVQTPWKDYAFAPDVSLVTLDPEVTAIDLAAPSSIQVARGTPSTDGDGTRQATLLVPPGTMAQMVLADGSTQPLGSLHVRVTEYTIGPDGPQAMPAKLPPTSGYTYAVEISADEALAAGATSVILSRPVPYYVENFLGFPVGSVVPVGYYDRGKGQWIAAPNGRVIKVLGHTHGMADLDTDGDGIADTPAVLAALGISDAERAKLAGLYGAGQSLWRVALDHFTPWDCNWPYGPGPGSCGPADCGDCAATGTCPGPQPELQLSACESRTAGSVIGCESQSLGESVPITGTPLSLHYQSQRVPGFVAGKRRSIRLTGDALPPRLERVNLIVHVAGRTFNQSYDPTPNRFVTFEWDGKDAFGRPAASSVATVSIGYSYTPVYYEAVSDFQQSFALMSGVPLTISRQDSRITLEQTWNLDLGAPYPSSDSLGGWTLSPHHSWNAARGLLVRGDGIETRTNAFGAMIRTVAGNGAGGYSGDGGPATAASFYPSGIAVAADGTLYIADDNDRIRRVGSDGIITTVAGNGIAGFSGDGGPAAAASLYQPAGVAITADGTLYIADSINSRIRRVGSNGIITTVAGNGTLGFSGDGGPATAASLYAPMGVAVTADGTLYIADIYNNCIRRVGSDGIITTVAGNGSWGFSGDGGPATAASLYYLQSVAVAADGALYIADSGNSRIRRVGSDGIITTVAGSDSLASLGDGGSATTARLYQPMSVAVAADGSFYIADRDSKRIRRVGSDGIITTVAGSDNWLALGDGGPATAARFEYPVGVAVAADGSLYIADRVSKRIRRVGGVSSLSVAAPDGTQVFRFDSYGRHLATIDALTGATLESFGYDISGRLISATDASGNVTRIERNGAGEPTAIISPDGQRTTLTSDANGYLAGIANPAGETYRMTYTPNGLLTRFEDPLGHASTMTYEDDGRLQIDANAAGGGQALARTIQKVPPGITVTVTTAEAVATSYQVQDLPIGDQRRTVTQPDRITTVSVTGTDGKTTTTAADGTVSILTRTPDPRFGMSASATSQTVTTPGGQSATVADTRTAILTNPDDPLSLVSLTDTTTTNGRAATSLYTAATRTNTQTSAAGRLSTTVLDTLGRPAQTQTAGLTSVAYQYDARGRLKTVTQGAGSDARAVTFDYGGDGYLVAITDALGRTAAFGYDLAGRVTAQTFPDGRQVQFGYDAKGNLISLTPPGRPAHTFNYTPVDLTAEYTPPEVGAGTNSTRYSYNPDKQLTQVLRPDGLTVNLGDDAAGRLATLTVPEGSFGYAYNARTGHLSHITAPDGGVLGLTYDGSLLTGATWTGAVAGSVGFAYDNDFRIASVSVNGANAVAYGYDPDSLLTQAGSLTLTRDPQNGLLRGSTLGVVTDAWTYNTFGEPATYAARQGGNPLLSLSYTRDKLGRITDKTETLDSVTAAYHYDYDLAGRLIEVKKDGVTQATWGYDDNGNRTHVGGALVAHYDDQDRLLDYAGATYAYTANGELRTKTVGGNVTRYQYDVLGNLRQVSLPGGTVIDYVIDAKHRRIGKKINGTLVQGFLYQDQLKPVAELDGAGNIVSRFVYATRVNVPDYMVKGGVTYRIVTDHLGSPRLVVNTATGAVIQRMDYDAWGKVLRDDNPGFQPFEFAGGLYDRDAGLVRFGARDYDAGAGRWLAKDGLLFYGGSANLYDYVENDPVSSVDPLGFYSWEDAVFDLADLSAGFGDTLTSGFGLFDTSLTGLARDALPGESVFDPCSNWYRAGKWSSYAWGAVTAGAGAARLAGWETKIAIHGAHHPFPLLGGKLAHLQINWWNSGVSRSGGVWHFPLPWK